jgi:hypothetical protein
MWPGVPWNDDCGRMGVGHPLVLSALGMGGGRSWRISLEKLLARWERLEQQYLLPPS